MSNSFIFAHAIEIGTKVSNLDVYRHSDQDSEIVYKCIIDKEGTFEIAKGFNGEWYDFDSGDVTNISELLGKIIDEKIGE